MLWFCESFICNFMRLVYIENLYGMFFLVFSKNYIYYGEVRSIRENIIYIG